MISRLKTISGQLDLNMKILSQDTPTLYISESEGMSSFFFFQNLDKG